MLRAIRLKDCQSWEDTVLRFSTEKPNILIANNSVGKSVLFKMLKITANPKIFEPAFRKQLIRFGASCAIIVYEFDDDSIGMTVVYPERVLYRFKRAEDTDFVVYSEPPQILLNHLSLLVNKHNDFIANIIDTDQDLYLIDTESASNVELLKLLAEEPVLCEVLGKINSELPTVRESYRALSIKESALESVLDSYEYVDVEQLEAEINFTEPAVDCLLNLNRLALFMDNLQSCVVDYNDYRYLIALLDILQRLQDIVEKIDSVVFDQFDYEELSNKVQILNSLYCIRQLDNICVPTIDLTIENNLISVASSLTEIKDKLNIIDLAKQERSELEVEIADVKNQINNSGCVVTCPIKGEVLFLDEKCIPYNN